MMDIDPGGGGLGVSCLSAMTLEWTSKIHVRAVRSDRVMAIWYDSLVDRLMRRVGSCRRLSARLDIEVGE